MATSSALQTIGQARINAASILFTSVSPDSLGAPEQHRRSFSPQKMRPAGLIGSKRKPAFRATLGKHGGIKGMRRRAARCRKQQRGFGPSMPSGLSAAVPMSSTHIPSQRISQGRWPSLNMKAEKLGAVVITSNTAFKCRRSFGSFSS